MKIPGFKRLLSYFTRKFLFWIPDKPYLYILFYAEMGRNLNLKNPKTFQEKIQWLKLYNRNPDYTKMVDKYAVKEYVAKIIGEDYIIPTIAVWNSIDEIDWDSLPDQFVLKTTHGGGSQGVIICEDKSQFDRERAIRRLNWSLKSSIYKEFREWPYKDVPRRIIAEKFVTDGVNKDLPDYKWYCFNGEPTYCQVIRDRHIEESIDFYDNKWNHLDFIGLNPKAKFGKIPVAKPKNLELMKEIVSKLSKDIPFVRVDLYLINDQIFFGEITFYPASGFGNFNPLEWNNFIGAKLTIN